ncbi:MAG: HAD family hydrolase [Chloroflexi bacterium]|nr:HAD family hydrolase [Chloroflexota bacterium]
MSFPLRAVSFDLWETLMHDTPESAERRRLLRLERLQTLSSRDPAPAYDELWQWLESSWWSRQADPGFESQIERLAQRLGVPAGDELRSAYVDPIFDSPPLPDPAAVPVLTELRGRGLRLALICNTSVTPGWALRRLLDGWGIGALLDAELFSDEQGIRKPAPGIFREAARQLGVDVSEMLHVGDRPDVDTAGAEAAGARALTVGPDLPLQAISATIAAQLNIRPSGQGAA